MTARRALSVLALMTAVTPIDRGAGTLAGDEAAAQAPTYAPAPATAGDTLKVRLARVDMKASLPPDLVQPEGRSRWDLRGVILGDRWVRTTGPVDGGFSVADGAGAGPAATRLYNDAGPAGYGTAARFAMPQGAGAEFRPGSHERFLVDETQDDVTATLVVDSVVAGIGWVELPSGPREVVLQRLLVLRRRAGAAGYVPDRLVHRWIDPLAGVVAEVSGPPSPDGRSRLSITEASILETVLQGAADLRLYLEDLWEPVLNDVGYTRDPGAGTTIASLTPAPGVTTAGDLIALSSWDFSGNTTGSEVAYTATTVSQASTCNYNQCGYTTPGAHLERSDRNWNVPGGLVKINAVTQLEERANETFVWLRAGTQKEGVAGAFGNGESRFCYSTFGAVTRTPAPLWVLSDHGVAGAPHYLTADDSWSSAPFNCEQNIFNQVCGATQFVDNIFSKACGTHTGTQFGKAIKGGVVTLPSGHTFNALVVRTVADFCVWAPLDGTTTCPAITKTDEVRTVNYLWQVPHVGTVVRLQSAQNVPDLTSFTTLAETDIAFGLYPPLSITATGATDTSVSLSWNPGLDTHRIAGYKVYWDTDSGASTPYAFDSESAAGQASITGTTAVISGLASGTAYHFTVTALSLFTDPSTGLTTRFESDRYPTQLSGDPDFVYPIEVLATTTGGSCIPAAQVANVTVAHDGSGVQICWDPVADPCLAGYEILGADTPESAAGFSVVADTGLVTCWNGSPASRYFLVTARGIGGNGPWGHYGR